MHEIKLNDIGKKFGRRRIFEKVNFKFSAGAPKGISGRNGAGKSTLVKTIANVISPNEGKIEFITNSKKLATAEIHNKLGFVAPYLILYSEFSPMENLLYISKIRGISFDSEKAEALLDKFNIYKRRNDLLRGFSSGMLQRMKFVFALYHNPDFILLDEPTSNLDEEGKNTVYEVIDELSKEKLVIVASNEKSDLELCEDILDIEKYKLRK